MGDTYSLAHHTGIFLGVLGEEAESVVQYVASQSSRSLQQQIVSVCLKEYISRLDEADILR